VFLSYTFSSYVSALSVIHSLAFQLASRDDHLQAILCQSRRENFKGNMDAAKSLLSTLLNSAGPVYIIIDGLDEICGIERGRLLTQLLQLSKDCNETMLLISSRAEADITETLKEKSAVIRVDNRNAGSIQTFVTQQTQKWFQERNFVSEVKIEIERFLAPIASNSKGTCMFSTILIAAN
jgi:hypothetical protein